MTSELSLVATGKGSNIMCGDQSDHVLQHWTVDISIDEHEGLTRAKARLRWREKELVGVGLARLNPADRNVPEIGDELSVARALSDLGKRMLKVSTHDIEAVTHQPARLSGAGALAPTERLHCGRQCHKDMVFANLIEKTGGPE